MPGEDLHLPEWVRFEAHWSACAARRQRDGRESKYKPHCRVNERLVFAFSYITTGRLRRPIERPHLLDNLRGLRDNRKLRAAPYPRASV